jgi:peptide/nickel transport system ATP-binding protein
MVWITHDLSVIAGLADRIAVMYAGRIVETGGVADTLERPIHPYTAGLIGSVPSRNKRGVPLAQIPGMTPSLAKLPPGCPFAPRCPRATAVCRGIMPDATPYEGARAARCHHPLVAPAPVAA